MAVIGLGRMGAAIGYRAVQAGYQVLGYDMNADACDHAQELGIQPYHTMSSMVGSAQVIWIMVPAGNPVDNVLQEITPHLMPGAIVIDGGNSKFSDSIARAKMMHSKGFAYLDCGTSGGVYGKEKGFCLMVGGDLRAYQTVMPLLKAIAAPDGVAHVGPSGAGHYVKMVHNAIEYAMLDAYAQGFQLLKEGSFAQYNLDLARISDLWNHGAVIRSWILELTHTVLARDQKLEHVGGQVEQTGTGRWALEDAHGHNIPVPIIEQSIKTRDWSMATGGNYATKIVALLRNAFGGHTFIKK